MRNDPRVYGYVNGKAYYTAEEFKYAARGRGAIDSDDELIEFARSVTCGWHHAGWNRTFESFYLSDYALSEPYRSLTEVEFQRLKELQAEARKKLEVQDATREWRKIDTVYWADNSIEETWEDKDGNRKTVMAVGPHGDVC